MLDGQLRGKVERGLAPVGRALQRIGITADVLTVIGLLASVGTAVLIGYGELRWAVLGVIATGVPDILDGAVARHSGRASPRGAFFDSVADRLSDLLLLGGCAWYLADGGRPREAVLAFVVAGLGAVVSYERAKAEALGYSARGGLMERAERLVLLAVGLLFSWLVPVLWIMAALTAATVVHRFVKVWRQAGRPPGVERRPRRLVVRRRTDVEGRPSTLAEWWQARRPSRRRERPRPARRHTRP